MMKKLKIDRVVGVSLDSGALEGNLFTASFPTESGKVFLRSLSSSYGWGFEGEKLNVF